MRIPLPKTFTEGLTFDGSDECEVLGVEVRQPLDEVNLLQSELHGVQVLSIARNIGRPELENNT
jgi:hypothetical protein